MTLPETNVMIRGGDVALWSVQHRIITKDFGMCCGNSDGSVIIRFRNVFESVLQKRDYVHSKTLWSELVDVE